MTGDYILWHKEELVKRVLKNLKQNFFDACYFNSSKEVVNHVLRNIYPGINIAFGGSMTVKEIELKNALIEAGANIIDHNKPGLSENEKLSVMRSQLTSDLFICSSNAVTQEGHLINVDGNGNRVAAMIFGPKKVIVIAGINKIVNNEQDAFKRLELIAGPMNMKRLERNTPCGADGICHDCSSPQRGCRAYSVIKKRPALTPFEVIIVGENIGM